MQHLTLKMYTNGQLVESKAVRSTSVERMTAKGDAWNAKNPANTYEIVFTKSGARIV